MASRDGAAPRVTRKIARSLPAPAKRWLGKSGAGAARMLVIVICSLTSPLPRGLRDYARHAAVRSNRGVCATREARAETRRGPQQA
ncbi:hypothetical protein DF047_33355 [Burkholderia cenocepacia]|nr:hypothetical protein DF047_33355 [Burkholderia cenocepacia]